nr:MAG TPA: hypothetical protein [Caudoviricetes sp.]
MPFWIGGKNAERNQRESVVLLPAVRQEDPPGSAGRAWRVCGMQAAQGGRHALQLARGVFLAERRRRLEDHIKQNIREPLSLYFSESTEKYRLFLLPQRG